MARLSGLAPIGLAQHVIQRGSNRQICCVSNQDMTAYVGWLKEYAKKYEFEIHAWVLMTNHIHRLCTPRASNTIRQMMQSLDRQYVRYSNFIYK